MINERNYSLTLTEVFEYFAAINFSFELNNRVTMYLHDTIINYQRPYNRLA